MMEYPASTSDHAFDQITRAIVIFPALADPAPIERLRRAYDPLADFIAPHITLVFPFTSAIATESLAGHMRRAARDLAPFEVTLREVTGHVEEYLFLNVKRGADELVALHDRLYSGILTRYLAPDHTFTPHLTVGRLDSAERFVLALVDARRMTVQFTIRVEEIVAYRIGEEGSRAIDCQVVLGQKKR
ncbi:MAG TPA: 2'-5' RNA ligase family protein [Ktedonobacterales bacterium]|jgi:2'-5' RNA ligase